MSLMPAIPSRAQLQITTVQEVLGTGGWRIIHPLLVLNKTDPVEDRSFLDVLQSRYPEAISVDAVEGTGIAELGRAGWLTG